MNPLYNLREMAKQLILLEDHLSHERKRCPDCIRKHLLTCEALAEEAVTLDKEGEHLGFTEGLAERVRGWWARVQNGADLPTIAQEIRVLRKEMVGVSADLRVASVHRVAARHLAMDVVGALTDTGEQTWQGGTVWQMDVSKDEFIHFTPVARAQEILESGKLLHRPPYKKFGGDAVYAVSTQWGGFEPRVATTHYGDVDLVGILFKTSAKPKVGFWEEVSWDRDVPLKQARIVPYSKAVGMLRRTPHQIDPDDMVVYGKGRAASLRVAARYKKKKKVKTKGGDEVTVYEYSERQVQNRHREKAERVEKLRGNIDKLRAQVKRDLTAKDPKTRLTALAVALMDETYERVGNEESAKDGHFGVTCWKKEHVSVSGNKATISYVGKSGVKQKKTVSDSKVVSALKKALKGKSKGDDILCDGDECNVKASDVNDYLKDYDITAKDIRGLHANEEMKANLKRIRSKGGKLPEDKKEREEKLKDEFKEALEAAAAAVGHEASTLRSQYLVPHMEEEFVKDGTVIDSLKKKAERFGPNTPLMETEDAKVRYRVKSNSRGIAVAVYYGRKKIGGMNAFTKKYPETEKACSDDVWALLERYPQVENTSRDRWVPSDGVPRTNTRALQVYKAFITDESKQGMGIGRAMYLAVMAEWYNKVGPFLFMPMACSGSGTSQAALRVWKSLARDFPSSGNVIAVLKRPSLPAEVRKQATKDRAEREDEETEKVLKRTPKKKPPRKDLRKRRIEIDENDKDPDEEQDRKDRSHNWKDVGGSLGGVVLRVALTHLARRPNKRIRKKQEKRRREKEAAAEEHSPGDVWKTDKGWRGMSSEGEAKTFPDKEQAETFAGTGEPAAEDEDGAAEGEVQDSDYDRARAEAESKARRERIKGKVEDRINAVLEDPDIPDKLREELDATLNDMGPKEQSALLGGFTKQMNSLSSKKELTEEEWSRLQEDAREAKSLDGVTPGKVGELLARAYYFENVLSNPFRVGGSTVSADGKTQLSGMDQGLILRDRSRDAYRHFKSAPESVRAKALSTVLKELDDTSEGTPRRTELRAIRDGLVHSFLVRGEQPPGMDEVSKTYLTLVKKMAENGDDEEVLGSASLFQGDKFRAAFRKAAKSMSDDEVADLVPSDSPLRSIAEALRDPMLSDEVAESFREHILTSLEDRILIVEPMEEAFAAANGDKDPPKGGKSTKDPLAAAAADRKALLELTAEDVAVMSEQSRHNATVGRFEALKKQHDNVPDTPATALVEAALREKRLDALSQRVVKAD